MMRRNRQDGSILLVAILVMIVMIAMALIVVQNVTMDMAQSGTYRVSKQGFYLTEAGLTGPIAMAAKDQTGFNSFLENKEQPYQYVVFMNNISPNFYDFSTWGSFGPEFSNPNSASFRTHFTDPVDTHRVPGFSTGEFCFRKYNVIAEGLLANGEVDIDDPDSVRHMAQATFMSSLYLGPFQCGF